MKIASGGVQHETNTFSDTPTTLADFQRDSGCGPDFSGGEILEQRFTDTGTIHGGYLAGAAEADVELHPLLSARAQPAGRVEQAAYDHKGHYQKDRPSRGWVTPPHGAPNSRQAPLSARARTSA